MHKVRVSVKSVKGNCAAGYQVGDYFIVEDPMIIPERPKAMCIYAIPAFIPYLTAYCRKTSSDDWINMKKELQCPDSTNTVIFELERV